MQEASVLQGEVRTFWRLVAQQSERANTLNCTQEQLLKTVHFMLYIFKDFW